jgi:hypothetical protein
VSIEKGATANDAPILKNISITHCQGSDCSPINNLATSLRKEVAGDIIVKDSLEYHQAKAAEQSNFQKEKQLEADRREQESSAQQQQNQKEQRKALEWELHLGETKSAFVITEEMKERQRLQAEKAKEEEERVIEARAEQFKQETSGAEAVVESARKRNERKSHHPATRILSYDRRSHHPATRIMFLY